MEKSARQPGPDWLNRHVSQGENTKYLDNFAGRVEKASPREAQMYIAQLCNEIHNSPDISEEERNMLLGRHLPLIIRICSFEGDRGKKTCATCTSSGKSNNYVI